MNKPSQPAPAGELLYGARAIAGFLGITTRQALHLIEKRTIPFWKEGRSVMARRESLRQWMDRREAAAQTQDTPQ